MTKTLVGLRGFLRGLAWLRAHKRYLMILLIPLMLGMVTFAGGLGFFFAYSELIFKSVLFARPDTWPMLLLFFVAKAFVTLAVFILSILGSLVVVSILSAPIYEIVSAAIERDFTGGEVAGLSFFQSLRLILEECKKALFILTVPILFLFIPGLNVLSTLIAAVLIGWDFFDYPLARRGWSFQDRFKFVMSEFWTVMGLGLWLVIPILQIMLMPLAVAGGTLLNLEALEKRQLIKRRADL